MIPTREHLITYLFWGLSVYIRYTEIVYGYIMYKFGLFGSFAHFYFVCPILGDTLNKWINV